MKIEFHNCQVTIHEREEGIVTSFASDTRPMDAPEFPAAIQPKLEYSAPNEDRYREGFDQGFQEAKKAVFELLDRSKGMLEKLEDVPELFAFSRELLNKLNSRDQGKILDLPEFDKMILELLLPKFKGFATRVMNVALMPGPEVEEEFPIDNMDTGVDRRFGGD